MISLTMTFKDYTVNSVSVWFQFVFLLLHGESKGIRLAITASITNVGKCVANAKNELSRPVIYLRLGNRANKACLIFNATSVISSVKDIAL